MRAILVSYMDCKNNPPYIAELQKKKAQKGPMSKSLDWVSYILPHVIKLVFSWFPYGSKMDLNSPKDLRAKQNLHS